MRRGDQSDPRVRSALEDPGIQATLDNRAVEAELASVIQSTSSSKLKAWVTVALWEDSDGNTKGSVIQDGHSTLFEVRGLLHDAVWLTAHESKDPAV